MELQTLIRFARGEAPVELLLKNARVVNVLSGEIVPSDVAIVRSRIVGLGDYEAEETLDLEGAYLAPGFIDAHVHIESSLVPPAEFARAVVPRGTTTSSVRSDRTSRRIRRARGERRRRQVAIPASRNPSSAWSPTLAPPDCATARRPLPPPVPL